MTLLRDTFSSKTAKFAGFVLFVVVFLTIFGPLVAPYDPLKQDIDSLLQGMSWAHPLGTDYLGRDNLSRIIAGTRPTMLTALGIVAIGAIGGALPGMASAVAGRLTGYVSLRVVDALLTFPFIVFAIAVSAVITNGFVAVIVAVGFLFTPIFFRIIRADAVTFASTQYVEASRLMGASRWWILRVHIQRKVWPTVAITISTNLATAVLVAASLSFIGIGVQPPTPTWGGMLADDVQYLAQQPWAAIWPGLAIVITVWAFNALTDALRDSLIPKSRVLPGAHVETLVSPDMSSIAPRESVDGAPIPESPPEDPIVEPVEPQTRVI